MHRTEGIIESSVDGWSKVQLVTKTGAKSLMVYFTYASIFNL